MAVIKKQPRAYELAKELGVSTKELLAKLADNGIALKGNFSLLENDAILLCRKLFRPLSGGPQAARELEEKEKKAKEAAAKAAEEAAAAVEEKPKPRTSHAPRLTSTSRTSHAIPVATPAPVAPPAPAAAPTAPAAPVARPAPARTPHAPARPAVTAARPSAAKPPPKAAAKPQVKALLKGPKPSTTAMPGLLSKPAPAPEPPAPVIEPASAAAEPVAPAPAPAAPPAPTPAPTPAPAPMTTTPSVSAPAPKPAPVMPPVAAKPAATKPIAPPAPPRPVVEPPAAKPAAAGPTRPAPMPGFLTPPQRPPAPVVARPVVQHQRSESSQPAPRLSHGGSHGRSVNVPARQPAPPPAPPRLVYFGPSPAPADYEPPRPAPRPLGPPTIITSGPGPQIRPQSQSGPRWTGRPGAPGAPGRPAGSTAPGAAPQKTIFRLDEKEEERKRKEREKELAKEQERQRRDAQREAHKKKQETYQARIRARETPSSTPQQQIPRPAPEPVEKTVRIADSIVVSELANLLGKTPVELITKLVQLGTMASLNQRIEFDVASIVAQEYGLRAVLAEEEAELQEKERPVDPAKLKHRPPVVTVMGHVDHGKTSLLDAIRDARVAQGEHGGITQHIGAYQVKLPTGQMVTFLDTPGHEAFTAMRAHGARVTDIAVLVVAADDGVMPQTEEAAHHAQAANVPIIVAINKMDKPGANVEKIKQQLTKLNLLAEEWGGKTICVPVSATKREGITQLLEMIVLQAEMLELKADPDGPARGFIVESEMDKGRGPVATVLVQEGVLKPGDPFTAGSAHGKVRALLDDRGRKVKQATPGQPVKVMGFDSIPEVAMSFAVVGSEAEARELAGKRADRRKLQKVAPTPRLNLEDIFKRMKEEGLRELKVIIKGDTHGSVTALSDSLSKISNAEVMVNVIHGGVGEVSENDVMFAAASDAIIIGFHIRPSTAAQRLANQEKVDIRTYNIIYEAVGEVEAAIRGMLTPKFQEVVFGHAEVRQSFSVPKYGKIAGSYVTDGKVIRNFDARVIRDGVEVFSGKITSLKRFKEDAKEVPTGFECGIGFEKFNDVKEKDVIEVFKKQEIPRD